MVFIKICSAGMGGFAREEKWKVYIMLYSLSVVQRSLKLTRLLQLVQEVQHLSDVLGGLPKGWSRD
jgi:hypothetical protein